MPAMPEMLLTAACAAILIGLAARIGWSDLSRRTIRNNDVLAFLGAGLTLAVLRAVPGMDWGSLAADLGVGLLVFATGLVFWLMRRLGAGDVKYLASATVAIGVEDLFPFLAALLAFSLVALYLARFPMFVPVRWHRLFFTRTSGTSLIPYGVLISLAVSVALLLQLARMLIAP